jgi:RNA polymerase sigma-70 factor (ECF subfamily)
MRIRRRLRALADEELMVLVARADADAYEVVYDRHVASAYSLAYRVCGDRASADEACQEAMLAVWRSAERYRAHLGSVRSWILTIAHHRAVDLVRRRTRISDRTSGDDGAAELLPAAEDTEREALAREQTREVQALLGALSPEQQRVVDLAFYGGFTQTEIAEVLAIPLGTVKSRMRLALDKLKGAVEAEVHA